MSLSGTWRSPTKACGQRRVPRSRSARPGVCASRLHRRSVAASTSRLRRLDGNRGGRHRVRRNRPTCALRVLRHAGQLVRTARHDAQPSPPAARVTSDLARDRGAEDRRRDGRMQSCIACRCCALGAGLRTRLRSDVPKMVRNLCRARTRGVGMPGSRDGGDRARAGDAPGQGTATWGPGCRDTLARSDCEAQRVGASGAPLLGTCSADRTTWRRALHLAESSRLGPLPGTPERLRWPD